MKCAECGEPIVQTFMTLRHMRVQWEEMTEKQPVRSTLRTADVCSFACLSKWGGRQAERVAVMA